MHLSSSAFFKRILDKRLLGLGAVELIVVTLLVCSVVWIRSQYIGVALERDEGSYAYYGKLILEGKVPYRDFSETKLPGLYYFYAIMVWIFGFTHTGLQQGFIFINIISLLSLYVACRNYFNSLAATVGAIVFAVLSLNPFASGFTFQSEHVVAMYFTLAMAVYSFRNSISTRWIAPLAGGLMGIAVTIKTNSIFLFCIPLVTALFINADNLDWKGKIREAIAYMIGALIAGIFIIGPVVLAAGGFAGLYGHTIKGAADYVSMVSFETGIEYLKNTWARISKNYLFFFYLGLSSIIWAAIDRTYRRIPLYVFILVFAFMTVVPGLWFYGHYWLQTFPVVAFLSAAACWHCTNVSWLGKQSKTIMSTITIVVIAFGLSQHYRMNRYVYKRPNKEAIVDQVYGGNPFNEALAIGNYINSIRQGTGGIIASIGSEPEIHLYTGTRALDPSYLWTVSLFNGDSEDSVQQSVFIKKFEQEKPEFAVFYKHPISIMARPGFSQHIFNWMNTYLTSKYKLVSVVDMFGFPRGSQYVFGAEQAKNYRPSGAHQIFLFQRI
jgi:hypothetical protein